MTTIFVRVGEKPHVFSTIRTLDEVSNGGLTGAHRSLPPAELIHLADIVVAVDSATGEARVLKNRYGPQWSDRKRNFSCLR